jgi:hypothetical protein
MTQDPGLAQAPETADDQGQQASARLSPANKEAVLLADLLGAAAGALFLVFGALVLLPALPPRPLDPSWLLRFTTSLTDQAALPLVGVALLFLAVVLNPASNRLRARRARWVTFGFLLLIPLQLVASWSGLQTARAGQLQQLQQADQKIQQIRAVVASATSAPQLQARLQELKAPALINNELTQPISAVKSRYLANLEATREQIRRQLTAPFPPGLILFLLQTTLRGIVLALGFSLAFAAAALNPSQDTSLLANWRRQFKKRPRITTKVGRRGKPMAELNAYYENSAGSKGKPNTRGR